MRPNAVLLLRPLAAVTTRTPLAVNDRLIEVTGIARLVVDHQDRDRTRPKRGRSAPATDRVRATSQARLSRMSRQADCERSSPSPRYAACSDLIHHFAKVFADSQAQSRAAVLPAAVV